MADRKMKRLSKKELLEMLIDKVETPKIDELQEQLKRENYRVRYWQMLRSTVGTLIVVAAIAVLIAQTLMPVLQIYGTSMVPTLEEGNIVTALKGTDYEPGDLVAFYIGNKILVKRYIAGPGEWVDIDEDGNVFINGELLEEPYLAEKAFGDCNIELPYQVPESRIFCIGDHRETSLDSRNTAVGCVSEEQIVGKIVFRVWPLPKFGAL